MIPVAMVGAMAKRVEYTDNDDLVFGARTDADALGRLYELYYDRIFRFCVHRLFDRETAEDITSEVFLQVASRIRGFKGRGERDFRNWVYAIAANQANAYIRKSLRRKRLSAAVAASRQACSATGTDTTEQLDWPTVYQAILTLKPEHQTIVTLRFFENLGFEEIGKIVDVRADTLRVTLHRILNRLRKNLRVVPSGE